MNCFIVIFCIFSISLTLCAKNLTKRYICDTSDATFWDNTAYNFCNNEETCCSSATCNSCSFECGDSCLTDHCQNGCVEKCNNLCTSNSCQVQTCSSCIAQCGNNCNSDNCFNNCCDQCSCDLNDNSKCCYVLHPKRCFTDSNLKKRCIVRRHRECSKICIAPIVAIRSTNILMVYRCFDIQVHPFRYCGGYELVACSPNNLAQCIGNIVYKEPKNEVDIETFE